jgi:hypothetical protein
MQVVPVVIVMNPLLFLHCTKPAQANLQGWAAEYDG